MKKVGKINDKGDGMNPTNFCLKLLFCIFICFSHIGRGYADPFAWSPSTPIANTPLALENVTTVYDPFHNRVIASWLDINTNFPVYSIYENGSWSAPASIDPTNTAMGLRSVYMCYDSQNNRVFAAWTDIGGINYYPTYAIFNNGSWSAPAVIGTNIPVIGGDVYLCYNSTQDSVFATWGSNTGAPAYSIYSGGTWSLPGLIDAGGVVGLNVYTCFNSLENKVIAMWGGANPTYSIYSGGTWSPSQTISGGGNPTNVFPCYNSLENEVMATWVDPTNEFPTYSVYNGTTWSAPAAIASTMTDSVFRTLFTCYDSTHNQIFVAWANEPDCDPIYSIYSNGVWSSPAFINVQPPGVFQDVFLMYNFTDDAVFATWTDCVTDLPYFSIYTDTNPDNLFPPTKLKGAKKSNKFATQTDLYNKLTWSPPTTGSKPLRYFIYRDTLNTLIGEVEATSPLVFEDHSRKKNKAYTYFIVSVDSNDHTSLPAVITVP